MTCRSTYLGGLAAVLLACCGCPSVSDPAGLNSESSAPTDAALELPGDTAVLSSEAAPACVQIGQPASSVHEDMYAQLNAYRVQNGLKPLLYSKTLEAAAEAQARNLYVHDFFDHIDPDGKNPGDRALDANFCHKYVGENIAAGQMTVSAVMAAWQNSPTHDANMLKAEYVYVGMGHYVDPTGRPYWSQSFAYDVPVTVAGR